MARGAWNFAHYTCGHSAPVRGGDRQVGRPCTACAPTPTGETCDIVNYVGGGHWHTVDGQCIYPVDFGRYRTTCPHDPQLCNQCAEEAYR